MTKEEVREILDDVFEEEALVIGGLAELQLVEDEAVDRLFRSLGVIRSKALKRIDGSTSTAASGEGGRGRQGRLHPAIEVFLARIGRN